MKVETTALEGVLILEPKLFGDARGWFMEAYNARAFTEATGLAPNFVQDNQSLSSRGVLRGLHYQLGEHPQDKLVRVLSGEIFDVAVDIRRSSPTFGQWVGVHLSGQNRRQVWVPRGFAHAFVVLSETAEVLYKVTDVYDPAGERSIRWDDPAIGIDWPLDTPPLLSAKDADAPLLAGADLFP